MDRTMWIDPKTDGAQPVEISAAALDVYVEMKKVRCTCEPEIRPPDEGWELWEECSGCRQWFALNHALLRMLGKAVPVYEYAVVPPSSGMAVEPGRAVERMCAFEEALAANGRWTTDAKGIGEGAS
jgi:hypothetical protein